MVDSGSTGGGMIINNKLRIPNREEERKKR